MVGGSIKKIFSIDCVNIYLFSIFFFNRFCPVEKCGVAHIVYMVIYSYGGLTRNDLYDTICMTLIRFLYDSTKISDWKIVTTFCIKICMIRF